MANKLDYLNVKSRQYYQFIVPIEKETDCMANKGDRCVFWEQDRNADEQKWLIMRVGDNNSNLFVISMWGNLLTWDGGVGEPKDMVGKDASNFGEAEFFWEIYWIEGEEENAKYHIVHKQTGDLLSRIGCNVLFTPDLRCATLWAETKGDNNQLFKFVNASPIDVPDVPSRSEDIVHPVDFIAKECRIKSWEYDVPKEVPPAIIGESLVPYFLLDGNNAVRFSKGPYYKLQRTLGAKLTRLENVDGDRPVKIQFSEQESQSANSIETIMEKMHIGVKSEASTDSLNLGAEFSYDLQMTKSRGFTHTSGSSSLNELSWPVGTKVRIAYWELTETFSMYDHQGNPVGISYSTKYDEITYWDDK